MYSLIKNMFIDTPVTPTAICSKLTHDLGKFEILDKREIKRQRIIDDLAWFGIIPIVRSHFSEQKKILNMSRNHSMIPALGSEPSWT
jgi:hypothetical protein